MQTLEERFSKLSPEERKKLEDFEFTDPRQGITTFDTGWHKIGEPIEFVVIIAKDKE